MRFRASSVASAARGSVASDERAPKHAVAILAEQVLRYSKYTNDNAHLAETLGRDGSHRAAIEPSRTRGSSAQKTEPSSSPSQEAKQAIAYSAGHKFRPSPCA